MNDDSNPAAPVTGCGAGCACADGRPAGRSCRALVALAALVLAGGLSLLAAPPSQEVSRVTIPSAPAPFPANTRLATFGAGCFWCVEAVFQELDGVVSVESGYAGGHAPDPTYEKVCSGQTGHAEVCQVRYDPSRLRYETLLEVFWQTHDPTTPDRQGADVGTQYRSVIFTHDDEQMKLAEEYKRKLDASGAFDTAIVTQLVPFTTFHKAENYHQDYFRLHGSQPYCRRVIGPKVEKFRKVFAERLKRP